MVAMAVAMVIGACASKRKAVKEGADATTTATAVTAKPSTEEQKAAQVVARLNQNRQTARGLRSKMSIRLAAGGKSASAGGTLKMKRDEIIQLSITALGLFEVGRMELTPDYLFVQDRMNKQYVQVAWADIAPLRATGADFYTFQALFWNELFVLGSKGQPAAEDFRTTTTAKQLTLTPKSQHTAVSQEALQFLVNISRSLLERAALTTAGGNLSVTCDYADFQRLENKQFPTQINLAITAKAKRYTADITLSNPQADESMKNLATKAPSGYKKVAFDDIIKQLVK